MLTGFLERPRGPSGLLRGVEKQRFSTRFALIMVDAQHMAQQTALETLARVVVRTWDRSGQRTADSRQRR